MPGRHSLLMLGTWGADVRAGGCSGNTLLPHLHQPRLAKRGTTAIRVCRAAHVNAWNIGPRRCAARLAHGMPRRPQRRCRQQVVCAAGQRYISPRQRWRQVKQDVLDLAERARQGFMCAHAHARAWQHAPAQGCSPLNARELQTGEPAASAVCKRGKLTNAICWCGCRALPFVVALLQLWQSFVLWSAPYRARFRAAKSVFDDWWEVRTERSAPALLGATRLPNYATIAHPPGARGQR